MNEKRAKEAYTRYQNTLGWDYPAFETLPAREIEAWKNAARPPQSSAFGPGDIKVKWPHNK